MVWPKSEGSLIKPAIQSVFIPQLAMITIHGPGLWATFPDSA